MQIEYRDINDLIPYERNAKLHPDSQVAKIARSIQEFGFRNPVLVDGQGVLIAGHGRVLAARQVGLDEVPVIDASDLTPEQVKAYRLADNRTAQSDWDWDLVTTEIEELKELDFDMELTGFDPGEIEGIGNYAADIPEDNKDLDEDKMSETENECPKCGFKW